MYTYKSPKTVKKKYNWDTHSNRSIDCLAYHLYDKETSMEPQYNIKYFIEHKDSQNHVISKYYDAARNVLRNKKIDKIKKTIQTNG